MDYGLGGIYSIKNSANIQAPILQLQYHDPAQKIGFISIQHLSNSPVMNKGSIGLHTVKQSRIFNTKRSCSKPFEAPKVNRKTTSYFSGDTIPKPIDIKYRELISSPSIKEMTSCHSLTKRDP